MVRDQAPALSVRGLRKRFAGGGGVDAVDLTVPRGSITAFVGVNGAGKSTTLRCILGVLAPDAGAVELFGAAPDKASRSRIGFLPEERGLAPKERARDAIAFYARLKGLSRTEAFRAADRLLERVGLGERRRARIGDLSKGNAQRVQILCALAHGPELLILDEPLSGLDPVAQSELMSLFAEFRGTGGSILFSTHSMAAAETLSDRLAVLAGGRTVFEGALETAVQAVEPGAIVVTADGAGLMDAARALGGDARPLTGSLGAATRWRVVLPAHVPHPALMRALAERSVAIFAFQPVRPSLETAFWDLAAPARAPLRAVS